MKKILVSNRNNVNLVSSTFDLVDFFDSSASLAIQIDGELALDTRSKLSSRGVRIIGNNRFNKIEQCNLLKKYDINHPETFYDLKTLEPFGSLDSFNSYVDLDEFVVKPLLGARGIGVKKISREDYKKCINDEEHIEVLFKKENEIIEMDHKDISTSYISNNFKSSLVQESIDVAREFRLIIFSGSKSIAYERLRKSGEFLGGLSSGSKPQDVTHEDFNRYLTPIVDKFKSLMLDLSYPWLSIDVYVDGNGKVGVFEFQMEFAYEGFCHKKVRDAMKECIDSYI